MRRQRWLMAVVVLLAALALPLVAQVQEPVDLDAIYRIKDEGLLQRSQVMEIMSYLTDVHGPRLTGSPNIRAAGDWAKQKLTEWGLVNAHLEPWTGTQPFGRGWRNERFYMNVTSPIPFPLIGYPRAWTPGTEGQVTAEVALAVMEKEEDFTKFKDQLKGKLVLTQPMREVAAQFDPPGKRRTDADLAEVAQQPIRTGRQQNPAFQQQRQFERKLQQFLVDEGVAGWIEFSPRGDGGTFFVSAGGARTADGPASLVRVVVTIEHYGRIYRMLDKKVPVTIEMNIQNKFYDNPELFNVIAEIPGTDKADEVVMLGGHFDSWHGGTGATDNAAGSAVMMEAVRILKATGLKMRRTVRIGLWSGEEQGLLGSRAYVTEHFADRATMKLKPEHAKLCGYFNVDNGTGKIRGVYLQGNEAIAPVLTAWMEPFRNMGMNTLAIRNTGGTDHLSFDAVGLPGFQFIQDEIEYDARTHHSNMDVYERIQEADMRQMAVIVASFVYQAANRSQMLPRKPLPKPQPPTPPGERPAN